MDDSSYDYNNFILDESPLEYFKYNKNSTSNKDIPSEIIKLDYDLKIYTVTWNLYGKKSDIHSIEKLIPKDKNYDIYAIGTEECMRSIFKSFFYSNKSEWEDMLMYFLLTQLTLR